MGGVRLGGTTIIPQAGTPFAVFNDDETDPMDEVDFTDIWVVPIGAPEGNANQVQLTTNIDTQFSFYPILSPSRAKILFKYDDDTNDGTLKVMNPDGSGITVVKAHGVVTGFAPADPCWCGNDLILYGAFTNVGGFPVQTLLCTATPGGVDNGPIVSVTPGGVLGFCGAPDGSRIAYFAGVGSDAELHACDPDGSNDDLLTTVTGASAGTGDPVWYLDGSAIFFYDGTGWSKINPDGSGETSVVATAPTGFWYREGMSPLGLFYTDTSTFSNWRLGLLGFDGSSGVWYGDRLSQAVQRGVAIYDSAQDRVFSVMHGSVAPGGVDTVFSVDMSAADPKYHYEADESGTPLSQTLSFR